MIVSNPLHSALLPQQLPVGVRAGEGVGSTDGVESPEGYAAVLQYIDSKGKEVRSVPGDAHRVSELATDLRKVRS